MSNLNHIKLMDNDGDQENEINFVNKILQR